MVPSFFMDHSWYLIRSCSSILSLALARSPVNGSLREGGSLLSSGFESLFADGSLDPDGSLRGYGFGSLSSNGFESLIIGGSGFQEWI